MQINEWQKDLYETYMDALDPNSFPVTTPCRVAMFKYESPYLASGLSLMAEKGRELNAMKERLLILRDTAKQSIEILEEDHGKAIFVFTTVTIIFLPL